MGKFYLIFLALKSIVVKNVSIYIFFLFTDFYSSRFPVLSSCFWEKKICWINLTKHDCWQYIFWGGIPSLKGLVILQKTQNFVCFFIFLLSFPFFLFVSFFLPPLDFCPGYRRWTFHVPCPPVFGALARVTLIMSLGVTFDLGF